MADWFTHTLGGWIIGKTTKQDIALVVVGSLIPDLSKLNMALLFLGVPDYSFFDALHTPIGTILVAGLIALFFIDIRNALLMLLLGVGTHFLLDFFLVHTHGGIKLLYPFSWDGWQIYVYTSDDYRVTLLAIFAALLIYLFYQYRERKKYLSNTHDQKGTE